MSEDMVAEELELEPTALEIPAELADFTQRMTFGHADAFLGLSHNTVLAAVEQGKCRYIKIGKRRFVTPALLAEFVVSEFQPMQDSRPHAWVIASSPFLAKRRSPGGPGKGW